MLFTIRPAVLSEKPVIFSLLQPYLDELSHFPDEHPDYKDAAGVYLYPYLNAYWQEEGVRFPYLLYSGDNLTGFALVRKDGDHWEMSEFYVKPPFRGQGLAKASVKEIFKKRTGKWIISFNRHNLRSRNLWHKAAKELRAGSITSGQQDKDHEFISFNLC